MARRDSIRSTSGSGTGASTRHTFDVILSEQKKLVENAQENLQKSISLLQNVITKEEYDCERLQVQSLLSRSEELMVTLQMISELRMEICHILRGITEAKRKYQDVSLLQKRLQWLEQRMEKLVLSKKRGRPGIRNRRDQRKFGHRSLITSHKPLRLHNQHFIEGVTAGEVTKSGGHTSASIQYSTIENVLREDDLVPPTPKVLPQTRVLSLSSKQSPTQDSDVWHSESEANWTMVENPLKDITQSQVLSEDEPKMCENGVSSASITGDTVGRDSNREETEDKCCDAKEVEDSTHLPKLKVVYGFEHPRPTKVFGVCSWNSLCLAINSNILQETYDVHGDSVTERVSNAAILLHAGLSGICEEIDSLNKLIQAAAVAATNTGSLLSLDSSIKTKNIAGSNVVQRRTSVKTGHCVIKDESDVHLKFPSLNCHELHLDVQQDKSHKKFRSHSYPRSSDEWHRRVNILSPKLSTTSEATCIGNQPIFKKLETEHDTQISRNSYRDLPSNISRSIISRCHASHSQFAVDMDAIYKMQHCEKHIEHLIKILNSASVETRKDCLLAIGTLPNTVVSKTVKDTVYDKFLKDVSATVRYVAMKCLISHGIVDETIIQGVRHCLEQGSQCLQLELLQFLNQDSIVELLIQHHIGKQLHDTLTNLLSVTNDAVTFEVSLLLVKLGVLQGACFERLHQALCDPSPKIQNSALLCLTNYCGCYSDEVISAAIDQMHRLADWKLRLKAVEVLKIIGQNLMTWKSPSRDVDIFKILLQRLFDEPVVNVRRVIGQLITLLKLEKRAECTLLLKLENPNPRIRAQAVIALVAFDWKNPKIIHLLLDCLELDPSIFVRVKVARALGQMKDFNVLVLKRLKEKSKSCGILAQECQAAWRCLLQRRAQ